MINKKLLITLCSGLLTLLFSAILGLASTYTYTTIDMPGAVSTRANGINNVGQIVGDFIDTGNWTHGFLLSGGSFTSFDYPGTVPSGPGFFGGTWGLGINDSVQIVGGHGPTYLGVTYGYLFSGGSFTSIPNMSGSLATDAQGINNAGQIVGSTENLSGNGGVGYLFSGGSFTTIMPPGATSAGAFGINNLVQIVGNFQDFSGVGHGYLFSGGSFTTIDVPSAGGTSWARTIVWGINDLGQIVGSYIDSAGMGHGFMFDGTTFTDIDFPGAIGGGAYGINNDGYIVGSYEDSYGKQHGFLAIPAQNHAPIAQCHNITVASDSSCTTDASIDSGSYDPDGDPITLTQLPASPYALGDTSVTLTVSDDKGASSQCTGIITVIDNTGPTITGISANPSVLWPPNNKMVTVTVNYSFADNCNEPTCSISSVTSNESISSSDYNILDAHHVKIAAQRLGSGNGRVYTVGVTCTDSAGNASTNFTTVNVPHDQRKN